MTALEPVVATAPVHGAGRSVAVDLVRAIGILGIVAGHVWLQHPELFFTWHVPVFFLLTGYLWRDGRSFADELQARVRSLLVPYVTWLLVVTPLWFAYTARTDWESHRPSASDLLLGGWYLRWPYTAYWFLTALLVAALVVRAAGRLGTAVPWLIGLAAVWLSVHAPEHVRGVALGAGSALVGVLFVAAGRLLRDTRARVRPALVVGPLLLVPAYLLGVAGAVRPLDLKQGTTGTPYLSPLLAVIICTGLVLTAEGAAPAVPGWLARPVTGFVRLGLAVILGHSVVLAVGLHNGMHRDVRLFLLATALPLVPALLVSRTRLAPLVLGRA